jgi:hypothetical protein
VQDTELIGDGSANAFRRVCDTKDCTTVPDAPAVANGERLRLQATVLRQSSYNPAHHPFHLKLSLAFRGFHELGSAATRGGRHKQSDVGTVERLEGKSEY